MAHAPYDSYNYPDYWQGREYEDEAERIALEKLFKRIPSKNSIIDIGGGFGRHAPLYIKLFKHCLLVEPSKKLLTVAKKNLKAKNLELKQGAGQSLPAKDKEFDVAMIIRVIHHIDDPLPVFKEISRILKPNGFLILEFANKIHFRAVIRAWLKGDFGFTKNRKSIDKRSAVSIAEDKIDFLNYHPQKIQQLLEKAGFKILDGFSVSNFRSPFIKALVPLSLLLPLESACQSLLYPLKFGPSIFLLAQRAGKPFYPIAT